MSAVWMSLYRVSHLRSRMFDVVLMYLRVYARFYVCFLRCLWYLHVTIIFEIVDDYPAIAQEPYAISKLVCDFKDLENARCNLKMAQLHR